MKTPSLRSDPMQIARLLQAESGSGKLPPVHLWNPPFCGDLDMEIKRNGQWFYLGTPIGRPALVKLFSSVLRLDDDGCHYLVTPVEKVRIRVEDAPFLVTTVERLLRDDEPFLQFTTLTGDVIVAGPDHPIRLVYRGDEPSPYVPVRAGLQALIHRNVYYQLIDWGVPGPRDGDRDTLVVRSGGQDFVIGHF